MKPYYRDERITLYHADCRDVLPCLGIAPDLVLTDPPYNTGKDYGAHNDNMKPDEYEEWCSSWFKLLLTHTTKRFVIFPGHGNLAMWYRIRKPTAVGCWYKPGNFASSIIGFEEWEPWLYWHGGNKGLLGGSSVIRQSIDTTDVTGHPCPKPVALMKKLLIKCRANVALDPFSGSGTTLVAAKALGIEAVGIELEERFCELTVKRLSQQVMFGETA